MDTPDQDPIDATGNGYELGLAIGVSAVLAFCIGLWIGLRWH